MIPMLKLAEQPEDFFRHVGNVFVKRILLQKGHGCVSHAHKHDHVTVLCHGSVLVKNEGAIGLFHAPAFIDIAAGAHHQFIATKDDTVLLCVHDTHGLGVDDLGESFEGTKCR